ncbi:GD15815 [Drosophila simulans]|uniref:GD15815 n=1 Tax=Drosophila simulans TaxID=7240 RepID=B4R553_DROSI|nr:GD15815 [Drosophila simulans]
MSSIEWVGDMLYYVMRTYLGLTAPSCNAHFLIDVLGKRVEVLEADHHRCRSRRASFLSLSLHSQRD